MPWQWVLVQRQRGPRWRILVRCRRCSHSYLAWRRGEKLLPTCCQNCRSKWWNEPSPRERLAAKIGVECHCLRPSCRHIWISTRGYRPNHCPKCKKTRWWRKPRKYVRRLALDEAQPLSA